MKEKKEIKKGELQVEEMPSKNKIIFAWILLIVLVLCTGGLVGLKTFYKPDVTDENVEVKNEISPVITATLSDIISEFNSNSLLETYKSDGLNLIASLKDATITVNYKIDNDNSSVDYAYNVAGNLSVKFSEDNKEINDKIFKVMVLACRDRLNLTEDVEDSIDAFLSEDAEAYGLKKVVVEDSVIYSVDVRFPLFEPEKPENDIVDSNETSDEVVDNNSSDDSSSAQDTSEN